MKRIIISACIMALFGLPAMADWDKGDDAKWVQLPDETYRGLDVDVTNYSVAGGPMRPILADDFECRETGYITNIHIWGSWFNDEPPEVDNLGVLVPDPAAVSFSLQIWSDNPNGPFGFSVPAQKLWQASFTSDGAGAAGRFTVREYSQVPGTIKAGYYNPLYHPNYSADNDRKIYQYNFNCWSGLGEFMQQGSNGNPVTYWLTVRATPAANPDGAPLGMFGWKTSTQHWNDNAVWAVSIDDPAQSNWWDLTYPPGHDYEGNPIDLAFVIQSEMIPEPSSMALIGLGILALLRRKK